MASGYNLDKIVEVLNKSHPKQIINKVGDLKVSLYKVDYSYFTNRGNEKTGTKYFVLNSINPQYDLKSELNDWVQEYNQQNEHRQISNVKFLDGLCLGYIWI